MGSISLPPDPTDGGYHRVRDRMWIYIKAFGLMKDLDCELRVLGGSVRSYDRLEGSKLEKEMSSYGRRTDIHIISSPYLQQQLGVYGKSKL